MMTGEVSLAPNNSTDWSRTAAPASRVGRELERGERRLVLAHGDLVARGAVDHVEQGARQLLLGERAQGGDAIAFALEGELVHRNYQVAAAEPPASS